MKRVIFSLLALCFAANSNASSITIDFAGLDNWQYIFKQYAEDGVLFVNEDGGSPGLAFNESLAVAAPNPGVFIVFPDIAANFVSIRVREAPIPSPEEELPPAPEPDPNPVYPEPAPEEDAPDSVDSVYLYFFQLVDDSYELLDDSIGPVDAFDSSEVLSFASAVPIAAVQVRGTFSFYLDDILISTISVPEPPTILLLSSMLGGFVGLRRKMRKN